MSIAVQTFYTPLPRFGVRLDRQWNLFREDFDHIAPLVRAAYADINSSNDSENDLAGLAVGELDFRNRYRIFYDKDSNAFLLQFNTGTEDTPIWTTRYTVRDSDGRLIVNSPGGLQSVSGFYNLGGIDLFVTQSGGFSFEDAGVIGFDSGSGFYFTLDSSGRPVLSLVAEAAAGTVTDGSNVGSQAEVFKDKSGTTLRFRTLAGSGLLTATQNANTIDFATSAENNTGSNLGSGTGVFESKVASDLRFKSLVGTGGAAISASSTEITIDTSANKFYGIIIKESESGGRVERDDTIVFDSAAFYIGQAGDDGKPLVSLQPEISLGKLNLDGSLVFQEVPEPADPNSDHSVLWASDEQGFTVVNIKGDNGYAIQISRDNILIVRNVSGSTIAAGSVVYASGSTEGVAQISLARSDSENTMPVIGITPLAISNNSFGLIIINGQITGIDLSSFNDGDIIWVSPTVAGGLTSTEPSHPNLHQQVGVVLNAATNGTFLVAIDHTDGQDFGTIKTSFTIGAAAATSAILQPNSTSQRTFTFPDKSGTVALTTDIGGAFYGVIFKESEAGGRVERDDTLVFDSSHFYLDQAGDDGKPLLSLSSASTGRNLGNGQGVFASQDGLELRYKSLTSADKIKLRSSSTEIEISSEFYLGDLLDVSVGAPLDDQVLTYSTENSRWEAGNKVADPMNVIINGNFDIWQRGTSFDKIDNFKYSADRWLYFYRGVAGVDGIDIDRDSTLIPDGRTEYSLKLTVDTADASIAADEAYMITQVVEGFNIQRFGFGSSDAQKLTLSFYVRASVAGIYYVFFKNSKEGTRGYVTAYQINAVNTWERKTITITADTGGSWNFTNGIGLVIGWTLACGTTLQTSTPDTWSAAALAYAASGQANLLATAGNTFNLSQVQLELGGSASSFQRKLIGQELQLCQRYFAKTFRIDTTPADGLGTTGAVIGKSANGGGVDVEPLANWFLPVTMRTSPTVTTYNTRSGGKVGQWQVGSTGDTDNVRVISTSETIVVVDNTGIPPSGSSAQQAYIHITADSEL